MSPTYNIKAVTGIMALQQKVKGTYCSSWETHLRAMRRHWDGLPARRWSPIQVLIRPDVEQLRWLRPTHYR